LDESSVPPIELGKAHLLQPGRDVALLAVGTMVAVAEEVAETLQADGFSVAVVNGRFVKPLDAERITALASTVHLLVTLEENTAHGGFGSGVLEVLSGAGVTVPTQVFGIPDRFIAQGSPDQQREDAGLSAEQVLAKIRERLFVLHAYPRRGRTKQRMPA
jgi:1-deoxy-D-xylulose-5-phosphate synthase